MKMVNHPNRNKPSADDAALKWKRVRTPDGTEHQAFVGARHIATIINEGDSSWAVRDIAKDTEDNGYPTLGDAKDAAEWIADA
jgi:hypothetical protein